MRRKRKACDDEGDEKKTVSPRRPANRLCYGCCVLELNRFVHVGFHSFWGLVRGFIDVLAGLEKRTSREVCRSLPAQPPMVSILFFGGAGQVRVSLPWMSRSPRLPFTAR